MMKQTTIREAVGVDGVGLHSGAPVCVRLLPAASNTGVVFVRSDLPGAPSIPARYDQVVSTQLCTTLGEGAATVATVEHLMAALYGMGVDNVIVDLNGPEVAILDGSAEVWVQLIESVGIHELKSPRRVVVVKRSVEVRDGDAVARFEPSSRFHISAEIDFDHPLISRQRVHFDFSRRSFASRVGSARTFAFKEEVEALQVMGLAKGGSLDNAIVIDEFSVVNPEGLRYNDEFVRHKVLDAIGDISLAGEMIVGHLIVERAGHGVHCKLLDALFADERNYRRVAAAGELAPGRHAELYSAQPAWAV